MDSVFKDDVEQGEGSCSQRRGHLIQVRAILSGTLGDLDAVFGGRRGKSYLSDGSDDYVASELRC
jgi:hypothetical protein